MDNDGIDKEWDDIRRRVLSSRRGLIGKTHQLARAKKALERAKSRVKELERLCVDPVNQNIEQLELSIRGYKRVKATGANSVADLCAISARQLRKVDGLGDKTLSEITALVRELN